MCVSRMTSEEPNVTKSINKPSKQLLFFSYSQLEPSFVNLYLLERFLRREKQRESMEMDEVEGRRPTVIARVDTRRIGV